MADTKRLATYADVQAKYGQTDYDTLDEKINEILVNSPLRSDYAPINWLFPHNHAANNSVSAIAKELCDRDGGTNFA